MEQPGEVEKVLMGSLIPGNGARIFTFFIKRALHLPRVLILRTTAFFRSKIGGSAGVSTCVCVCVWRMRRVGKDRKRLKRGVRQRANLFIGLFKLKGVLTAEILRFRLVIGLPSLK